MLRLLAIACVLTIVIGLVSGLRQGPRPAHPPEPAAASLAPTEDPMTAEPPRLRNRLERGGREGADD